MMSPTATNMGKSANFPSKINDASRNGETLSGTPAASADSQANGLPDTQSRREMRLAAGLTQVIRVTDQLLLCPDEDSLVRCAIELARERLGIERFAIFLDIPDSNELIGTYGTDMRGETTVECGFRIVADDFPSVPPPDDGASTRWVYTDRDGLLNQENHENVPHDRDWMVATPIFSASGRIGVAFLDAAISRTPVDETLLNIVTIYCSLLGSMIESKRAAEAARQSQRQTSESLGIVMDMADELVLCPDLDSLLRRAVEMARERLGIERLGIFLKEESAELLQGTYGIDREGNFRDERMMTAGISSLEMPTPASKNALSRLKIYHHAPTQSDTESDEADRRSRDWVVTTPIQSSQGVIGVCFNDNALSKHAMNEAQQEQLALFCSMLGNMIESQRAAQAMRENQRSISTLMSNLPGMAYRCRDDAAWTMDFASQGALELLGYAPDELMGNRVISYEDVIYPDDRPLVREQIGRGIKNRGSYQFAYRVVTAQGQVKWVSEQGAGIFSPDGELIALEGFINDITARKQAEEELRQAKDELEARVRERTAELAQANNQLRLEDLERQKAMAALHDFAGALKLAKEEAERANGAKSEFLSRMSHELRTPLNAILGFGQVLEMADLPPKRQEAVAHILRAGRHLLGLINEVLDIARVEAGHLDLSLEAVDLAEVVTECCALVRPLAAQRGIPVREECRALQGHHVMADQQRLKQVLLNLLGNAIKYNREAGQVTVFCTHTPGDKTSIAVRDTGPGLSPSDQAKLFSPFERLSAAHSEVEGTGLGLVLSQRLVELMGGTLRIESEIGQGSTFIIELPGALDPRHALETARTDVKNAAALDNADAPAGVAKQQVLVIEDNLSNLRLLEVVLEGRPQIQLLAAMQGSVGLDLARQHRPDLILLDLNLPDISGRDVLARLQESDGTREIPVIIISADATAQQIERLLSAGAASYLTKPLNIKQFLQTLDEMLEE